MKKYHVTNANNVDSDRFVAEGDQVLRILLYTIEQGRTIMQMYWPMSDCTEQYWSRYVLCSHEIMPVFLHHWCCLTLQFNKMVATWVNYLLTGSHNGNSNQTSLSAWRNFASSALQNVPSPVKIQIRLRECAGWSESLLDAHVWMHVFWRYGLRDIRPN